MKKLNISFYFLILSSLTNADVLFELSNYGHWSGHRGGTIDITHVDCSFFLNNDAHNPISIPDETIYWENITLSDVGKLFLADTTSSGYISVVNYLTNGIDNKLWAFVKSYPEGGNTGVSSWESYYFGSEIDLNGYSIEDIGLRIDWYNSTPEATDVGVTYIVYGSPVPEPTTFLFITIGGI